MSTTATTTCMMETCDRRAACRGLCWPCYQTARKLVLTEESTFSELERMGLILKPLKSSLPNPLAQAFRAGKNGSGNGSSNGNER